MHRTTIAVDVAKSVFEVAVSNRPGHVRTRQRLSRAKFTEFIATTAPTRMVMEACGSAHYWARQAQRAGHEVRLLPPHAVRPYVPRNKTDRTDVKGLLEADRNEEIRTVPVKTESHQAIVALHRLRATWQKTRTARLNALRGTLREFGLVMPVGARHVVPHVRAWLADADGLVPVPPVLQPALVEVLEEIRELERRIRSVERQLAALARQTPVVERLCSIPGIGVLTATALVAAVGHVHRFPSARHFASYLGLTPREHSTGLHRRLGAISKRGDRYLRTLLIHGARAVLHAKRPARPDGLRTWASRIRDSRGANKATVALANKLARIAWAVWRHATPYRPAAATA
jgi:transposase